MPTPDITMRSSTDPAGVRFVRLAVDGSRLLRSTWTGGRTPRETVTELAGPDEADREFERWRRKKLDEGFAYVADAGEAARGDVVLDVKAPHGCTAEAFDLSPDGRTLVVGTMLNEGYSAELHLIDVATGDRELVHTEPQQLSPDLPDMTFVHATLFDATGRRVVYALNGETRVLDLDTRHTTVLARYTQFRDAAHAPSRCRPMWDAERRRLLVFDTGDRARVLDRDGTEVFAVSTQRCGFTCWTGGLSPSGRLLALCFCDGEWYADSDVVDKVEVWDVEEAAMVREFPLLRRSQNVGFDPKDTVLVTKPEHADELCAYDLGTGGPAWLFPHPYGSRATTCYSWAYSPDGGTLAVGHTRTVDVVDAATRTVDPAFGGRPEEFGTGRTHTVRISRDGTLLAYGGDSGTIVVRRL